MAGAAGGALQTGQRIGSAIGTAALASVFYAALSMAGGESGYSVAISDALLFATGIMLLALLMAVVELVRRRSHDRHPSPSPRPEHDVHHV
jgi:hypothetical protein